MISLSRYYKLAAILPLGLTTFSGMLLSITHDGSEYKSEWSTQDGFVLTVFFTILLSAFITLLSLAIFLNKIVAIKTSALFSFLSWIALPAVVCGVVVYLEVENFSGYSDIGGVYPGSRLLDGYIISMAIVHLTGLFATYVHFKRQEVTFDKNSR